MLGPLFQLDGQQCNSLINIVVELPRDPGAFLFMGFNQPAPNVGKSFLGLTALCDLMMIVNNFPPVGFEIETMLDRKFLAVRGPPRVPSRWGEW